MVPNPWYPGEPDAQSQKMVREYVAQYGGPSSGVNADVAEAYSVGQVLAQAVKATHSLSNTKIIAYLHSGATLQSVQGPVRFNSLGENVGLKGFTFQWQPGTSYVQVLPVGATGSKKVAFPKPSWGR
jgi:ABC-type branched-subunit amino acid transport system substrate-binding protein